MLILSYLIWDPSPGMFNFNLPILNRPILWYGFLFAFGFFIGYLVLTYLLRRYFLLNVKFCKEDVLSWPDLIKIIGTQHMDVGKAIFFKLNKLEQKWCQNWRIGQEIPEDTKKLIISAMNELLSDREICFSVQLSSLANRLLSFATKNKNALVDVACVKKRLQIENELSPILYSLKARTAKVAEQITFYVMVGAIIGARLGDVLFYQDWKNILNNPSSIMAIWEGGLASHGGAIGILVALWIFAKKRRLSFLTAIDFTVIPTAIAAVFIRLGNFFNQEILGHPTTVPWGILFLHPADGGAITPRHPAQLYEGMTYLCIFILLIAYWRKHPNFEPKGNLTGLFLIFVFGARFLIEFLKVEQSAYLTSASLLTMGQWLSLPFFIVGLWLFFRKKAAIYTKRDK
jgi:prolipoprotein diacylglyceryl transferase